MQAVAAMTAFFFVLRNRLALRQELAANDPLYLQATTACLSAIVVMQIANVFLCRSAGRRSSRRPLFSNNLIIAGIAAEIALILLIDYTPWGNALFGTAPIGYAAWLMVVPFAAACCCSRKDTRRSSVGRNRLLPRAAPANEWSRRHAE